MSKLNQQLRLLKAEKASWDLEFIQAEQEWFWNVATLP
jgi:hypothetical protein